jgi:hypothetical protein
MSQDTNRKIGLPPSQIVSPRGLIETDDGQIEVNKLNEIANLLWLPKSLSERDKNARIVRALELFEDLAPQDGVEGMLCAQMVGTHVAALECLRRAALPEQTPAGRDMNLRHAQKLMALYTQQMTALNKHRGKGQQKVTVEHVNVASGGQAIVGNVETPTGRVSDKAPNLPETDTRASAPAAETPRTSRKKQHAKGA